MQTSVYVNSENHHLLPKLFNIGILRQMFKMSAVCRNTSTETLTPLLDSVVDDALVHAFPLLQWCAAATHPESGYSLCRRVPGARPIHDSLPDLDPDC